MPSDPRLRVEIQPAPEGTQRPTFQALLRKALALTDAKEEGIKKHHADPAKE